VQHTDEESIGRFLEAGERVLWVGRPGQGIRLRADDRFAIPFTLLWAGFFVFWEYRAFHEPKVIFRIWGIPFLIAGAWLSVGRFFTDARRRARSVYAVTYRRILVIVNSEPASISTFNLRTLPAVTLAERGDGSGDVVLDASDNRHIAIGGIRPEGSPPPAMLEFLPDAQRVYGVICEAQRRAV
jgi:hypothetical protein